jgi:hypothetical protein
MMQLMNILKHNKTKLLTAICFLLLVIYSTAISAAPLVWNVGEWGDEWQALPMTSDDLDGDTYTNNIDIFPLDPAEWSDWDMDGIGDNSDIDDDNDGILDFVDTDDDNDGLSDTDEITFGTDPLNPDSDGDGVTDGEEVMVGRNPALNEGIIVIILNNE